MEESLVNLVGNTIKELAPAAQVLCKKQLILWKLGRMGIFRVVDLQTMVDSDIQMASPEMVVCCISPHATCPPRRLVSPARTLMFRVAKRVVLGMYSWQIRVLLSKKDVTKSAISSRFKR